MIEQETISVVIPTYKRVEMLERAIDAFLNQDYPHIKIYVVMMKFPEINERIRERYQGNDKVEIFYFPKQIGWAEAQNFIASQTNTSIFYGADDIEPYPDCLSIANETLMIKFPDLDGVVGVNQVNLEGYNPYKGAFGLIGRKYLNRFKDRKWVFPLFFGHFSDMYSTEVADHLGKFIFEPNAKLIHHHPCVTKKPDECTTAIRMEHGKDKEIRDMLMMHFPKHLWGNGTSEKFLMDATWRFRRR